MIEKKKGPSTVAAKVHRRGADAVITLDVTEFLGDVERDVFQAIGYVEGAVETLDALEELLGQHPEAKALAERLLWDLRGSLTGVSLELGGPHHGAAWDRPERWPAERNLRPSPALDAAYHRIWWRRTGRAHLVPRATAAKGPETTLCGRDAVGDAWSDAPAELAICNACAEHAHVRGDEPSAAR